MFRLFLSLILLIASPAVGHFSEDTHVREIVLDETGRDQTGRDQTTRLYLRVPLPLVFADRIAVSDTQGTPLDAPFLYVEDTDFGPRYRLSLEAVEADRIAFAARLAGAHAFRRDGEVLAATVESFRLLPRRPDTPLDSAAAAIGALDGPSATADPIFGEAVVEYVLTLPPGAGRLTVQNALPEIPLTSEIALDTHLTRDTGRAVWSATVPGQLMEPVSFPEGPFAALWSYLVHGLAHIVTGLDHVFLVVCFALGIGWSRHLLWVVTAFTLGHSVTLVLGASGLVPGARWFIPAVEAAIAVSVVLAAVAAWRGATHRRPNAEPDALPVTLPALLAAGVGLIHGFGFASFLSDSLTPGSPAFVPALAGFNIGLEIGQLLLVAVTVLAFAAVRRLGLPTAALARTVALAAIGGTASWWAVERIALLVA